MNTTIQHLLHTSQKTQSPEVTAHLDSGGSTKTAFHSWHKGTCLPHPQAETVRLLSAASHVMDKKMNRHSCDKAKKNLPLSDEVK